jgi:hypothetical protein
VSDGISADLQNYGKAWPKIFAGSRLGLHPHPGFDILLQCHRIIMFFIFGAEKQDNIAFPCFL